MDMAGWLILAAMMPMIAAAAVSGYRFGYRDGRTQAESDRLVERLDELIKKEGER